MEKINAKDLYDLSGRKKYALLAVGVFAVVILGMCFVTIGVSDTSVLQVINAVLALTGGEISSSPESAKYKIILFMRLPRITMAVAAGIGMSVAGTSMQAITRNPLVSPFTVGVSSAAAFGASMCIVFAESIFFRSEAGIVLCAFLSAVICAAVVYAVSSRAGMSAETVVLSGIALNYFFNALTAMVEFFAEEHKLAAVVQWTFGTFNGVTWAETAIVCAFVLVCTTVVYYFRHKLNIMASGDDETAKSLGVNTSAVRAAVGLAAVLMTASIISFTGVIGFVGLVAPHIARIIVGGDHKFLIPFSAICGALLLMAADTLGRVILSPVNIPVGIIVSFIGVPLFIHLILKDGRRERYGA